MNKPAVNRPDLTDAISRLRSRAPLIHNITNFVVMNTTANALLAIGASPAMVHALEEVEDFAPLAKALVINIGTLSPAWVGAMERAAGAANAAGVPWILDPVGGRGDPLPHRDQPAADGAPPGRRPRQRFRDHGACRRHRRRGERVSTARRPRRPPATPRGASPSRAARSSP